MKKTLYITFSLLAVLACNKEYLESAGNSEADYNKGNAIISAEICDGYNMDGSKTFLIDSDSDRYIRWMGGDMLGIYGDKTTQNTVAELNEDSEGQTTGAFLVGGPFASPEFAYYPYSQEASYFSGTLEGIGIPSTQSYVEGKAFSGTGSVMIGKYDTGTNSFKFKNACALIEVQLTGSEPVVEVQLVSFSKYLAGSGSVQIDDEPVFAVKTTSKDASHVITLKLDEAVSLSSTPTPFYFIVAPGTYDDLIVRTKNEKGIWFENASTRSHTVARKHILPMNPLATGKPVKEGAVSLSENGCANTYMIAPDAKGMFCFDVKHVDGKAFAKGNSDELKNGLFADVLWESEACLISNAYYDIDEDRIYFRKGRADAGTALISLFNEEETIIWNWLIWCSDVSDQTWGAAESRYTFQDRFLGATWVPKSAAETIGNTDANYVASTGFLYQYGRYIPVPGCNKMAPGRRYEGESVTSGYKNPDGNPINKNVLIVDTWQPVFHNFHEKYSTGWEARNQLWTLDEVSAHPLSVNKIWATQSSVYGSSYATGVSVTGTDAIWAVKKTNYDPCPPGYRVPQLKEISIFYNDGNGNLVYTNGTAAKGKASGIFGGYTEREGNFIWIPKAGMRTFGGGDNSNNGYSYTMAYWGDYNFANGPWYDGTANIWTFNPEDTQDTLTGCFGYGGSWKTPSTGDVHARFVHMCGTNEGPQTMTSNEKPVVGVVGESMSIRCVKIK